LDRQNIPAGGSYLVFTNHYSRPGFSIAWASFAISDIIPVESCWVISRAWTAPQSWMGRVKKRITSILFEALAGMYGFVTMLPMPPDPHEIQERVLGIRKLMRIARRKRELAICMAPEGRDFTDRVLGLPPQGSGRLIAQLLPANLHGEFAT